MIMGTSPKGVSVFRALAYYLVTIAGGAVYGGQV